MSVAKNAIVVIAKFVEDSLRCRTYTRGGKSLNAAQIKIWTDALTLTALAWYDLIPNETTLLPRWMKPWLQVIASTDILDVVETFKKGNDVLLNTVSSFSNYETFKQSLTSCGHRASLFSPVKVLVDRWYLERDPADFRLLRTCFSFILRINLPDLTDLVEQAKVRYVATEASLGCDFLMRESEIIEKWFPLSSKEFIIENWLPKHGPGSTADCGNNSLRKYRGFRTDDMVKRLDLFLGGNTLPYTPVEKLERTSKVVFVPKSVDKLRTISMEPATIQWYQQGLFHALEKYIEKHVTLSRRITLRDQSTSRELAYLGSIDGNYATIDLSDASDRVAWDLIIRWTRRTPLLPFLWMTRTRRADIGGEVVTLKKSSPMGSATCFPIECLVFSAITEASIIALGGSVRDSSYRVYGDDIIVETQYANEVIRRLTENGFIVNTSKSYFLRETHNFRESCGGEFLDGCDVTPLRLPRNFYGMSGGSRQNPSQIASLVEMCNDFYISLPSVRRYIIWDLMKIPKVYRPVFDHDGSTGIFSPTPTNFHLQKPIYVARYQQWYLKHGGLHSPLCGHGDEQLALFEHLRSTFGRQSLSSPEDKISVALGRKPRLLWSVMKTAVDQVSSPNETKRILREGR